MAIIPFRQMEVSLKEAAQAGSGEDRFTKMVAVMLKILNQLTEENRALETALIHAERRETESALIQKANLEALESELTSVKTSIAKLESEIEKSKNEGKKRIEDCAQETEEYKAQLKSMNEKRREAELNKVHALFRQAAEEKATAVYAYLNEVERIANEAINQAKLFPMTQFHPYPSVFNNYNQQLLALVLSSPPSGWEERYQISRNQKEYVDKWR